MLISKIIIIISLKKTVILYTIPVFLAFINFALIYILAIYSTFVNFLNKK